MVPKGWRGVLLPNSAPQFCFQVISTDLILKTTNPVFPKNSPFFNSDQHKTCFSSFQFSLPKLIISKQSALARYLSCQILSLSIWPHQTCPLILLFLFFIRSYQTRRIRSDLFFFCFLNTPPPSFFSNQTFLRSHGRSAPSKYRSFYSWPNLGFPN